VTTAFLYDPVFLGHDTGPHPENRLRLERTVRYLHGRPLWSVLEHLPPRDATDEDLLRVHTRRHVDAVRALADAGGGAVDADTVVSAGSFAAALRAAGALLSAADAVMAGDVENAFAAVRPPGHHACPERAMGFCLFNNVAVAARYLRRVHGLARVAVVDFDVHHGNGTQMVFDEGPDVFYFSIHRAPFYPGTGAAWEDGRGAGKGATLNVPVPFGTRRAKFLALFRDALAGPVADFGPDFLLVSAGFDGYADDPIAGLGLESEDYAEITRAIRRLARGACDGRLVSTLEGGYHLGALPRLVGAHLEALCEPLRDA